MGMRVGYVVNSVGRTSVPATIAVALENHTDVTVDLVAWFGARTFEGSNNVDVHVLDAPDTPLGIDRTHCRSASSILSDYDLIQAHHPHSGSFAKVIAHRLGIPSVSREGNTRDGFTRKGRIANGLTNPLSEYVVCNSQGVYNSFTRWERTLLGDDKVRFIPNGVDLERVRNARSRDWSVREEYDIDQDTVLVGNAAIISEQKAYDVLIRGTAVANDRSDESFELVVTGDGDGRSDLEELARTLGIAGSVHFLGLLERDDVYRMMDELDVFAMPSRWEGFANAAVEALGVGNACVFSDIEPFSIPYEDVALFHPVDDHETLADQLVRLGESPSLRADLADRGRALVEERYTLESVARQYRDLYYEVLSD